MTVTECSSCGRDDEPLTEVRRIYVVAAAWDTEGSTTPAEGTEHWCGMCMAHYPHEVLDD